MRTLNFEPRIFGRPTSLLYGALLALLLCLSALTLHAQEDAAAPEAAATARPAASDTASRQLISNFLTVVGGDEAYNQIKNVVARGSLEEAGKIKTFQLIELQDGKRHLRLNWRHLGREYEEQLVFNGRQAWRQELSPKNKEAVDYSGQEGIHFSRQRWLLQPLVPPSVANYVFKYQGSARVGGRPCYVIVGHGQNDERSWFYFDQQKCLLLRWGGFGEIAGVREYMDYRASKFQRVGGVLLPKEIDLLAENSAFGRIQFDSIRSNQEIEPGRFDRPMRQTPVLRQRQKR